MKRAQCKINKAGLLIEACNLIDQMQISQQNQDVQGDLYEYMLGQMQFAGRGGQFRTPRHIIRMMVQMVDPKPHRAHWRSGGRDGRVSRQRAPVYFGEAYVGGDFGVRRRGAGTPSDRRPVIGGGKNVHVVEEIFAGRSIMIWG